MQAHLEILCGVLRLFPEDAVPYKSPYIGSATVQFSNEGKTATILGMTMYPQAESPRKLARAIHTELTTHGVKHIHWQSLQENGTHRECHCESDLHET